MVNNTKMAQRGFSSVAVGGKKDRYPDRRKKREIRTKNLERSTLRILGLDSRASPSERRGLGQKRDGDEDGGWRMADGGGSRGGVECDQQEVSYGEA